MLGTTRQKRFDRGCECPLLSFLWFFPLVFAWHSKRGCEFGVVSGIKGGPLLISEFVLAFCQVIRCSELIFSILLLRVVCFSKIREWLLLTHPASIRLHAMEELALAEYNS